MTVVELEALLGRELFDHQREAVQDALAQHEAGEQPRLCLYHRTGAGKTITSLAVMRAVGADDVLVLAPPITHDTWQTAAKDLGLSITTISHAKFRQKNFRITRTQPIIVDEFHLLGGFQGQGWKKLDRASPGLKAPLVIASATPNYNDAERVYCIYRVLHPGVLRGGFLQFLYDHCITMENPFGRIPLVEGFREYPDAEQFLASLPKVHYVEDEMIKQVQITDIEVAVAVPPEFEDFGLNPRTARISASQMEEMHVRKRLQTIGPDGMLWPQVYDELVELAGNSITPVLIFSNSAEIAEATQRTLQFHGVKSALITGKTSAPVKQELVDGFRLGEYAALVGTATLATGTDGIDKVCDTLIIVDDTFDDALRRQLMGRILPRGADSDVSNKVFARLKYL